jgi:hypothetical protein
MMDIELEIEGLPDRRLADAIRRSVRVVRQEFASSGEWRVAISPSETRGEWDVGVRTPSGWRLSSFTGSIDGLPAFVDQELRESVRLVPLGLAVARKARRESAHAGVLAQSICAVAGSKKSVCRERDESDGSRPIVQLCTRHATRTLVYSRGEFQN